MSTTDPTRAPWRTDIDKAATLAQWLEYRDLPPDATIGDLIELEREVAATQALFAASQQSTPTTPAEPLDLDTIEARVPHGYDAPWRVTSDPDTGHDWYVAYDTDNPLAGLVATVPDYGYNLAEFIAHARTDVPALLARVRELEADVDRLWQCAVKATTKLGDVVDHDRRLADAHAETMQIAGELANERTAHQETIAERNWLRGELAAVRLGFERAVNAWQRRAERAEAEVARLRGELEVPDA